jgi:CheY-like chemotaxis protein
MLTLIDPGAAGDTRSADLIKTDTRLRAWEAQGGKTAPADENMRILIVDDDQKSADSLELMLHAMDFPATRVAYSGRTALTIAAEFTPDVVLIELNLLDTDGYEIAQELRERAQGERLRLIALTSSREHPGRERARVAGCERYLLKPVTALGLLKVLATPP